MPELWKGGEAMSANEYRKMPYDGEAFKREIDAFFAPRKRRKSKRKRKGRCLGGAKVKGR